MDRRVGKSLLHKVALLPGRTERQSRGADMGIGVNAERHSYLYIRFLYARIAKT